MAVSHTQQGSTRASASKASVRRRLKRIHVKRASGGFVATHHFHPEYGGTPAPTAHVFPNYAALHAHVEQAMKGHTS